MIDFCRAYFILGTLERYENRHEAAEASFLEAQSLWYKGDQIKLHRFNAACIYKTGVVCLDQGKVGAAMYATAVLFSFHIQSKHYIYLPESISVTL